ncbi:hypothetical protein IQ251_06780 [Saccharopolyspora sp. HNM0983]|uniref:ATP-binding protein n=1 Tax=Saccharopolyspora montiporae TaxID=2781240 RepID=A0A929FX09_9PSEU|nr:hypothetical protein [Saccharopolyspora sp. HNM0983]MBE9374151.1 hypothetical protein [Saccharopolyspora sp. HNM0983]
MKRTLTTAAAMLVGGAGAAGFAAPAGAAGAPELPAELPTDNNAAQTAYHAAGTLESAKRSVGEVVPLEQLAGRSGGQDPAADLLSGSGQPLDALEPVGEVLQGAGQSGARSGDPTGDLLAGGLGGALDGTQLDGAQATTPQTKPANPEPVGSHGQAGGELTGTLHDAVDGLVGSVAGQAPAEQIPAAAQGAADEQGAADTGARTTTPLREVTEPGEAVDQLAGELPIGEATPAVSGLTEQVGDVVAHGPLGGETQLGG